VADPPFVDSEEDGSVTRDQPIHSSAPVVVPRWEWRTFGDLQGADEALAQLRVAEPVESDETYLLSMHADASVKVRDGLLDVKILQNVNGAGLQLWLPTMKADFPLDEAALAAACAALGVPLPPQATGSDQSQESVLDELVGSRDDLRSVEVHKSRRRSILDGCMVELTDLRVDGESIQTVAVESEDPSLVVRTIRALGLEGRRNVCVAQGIKSLLGWGPTRFAVLDVGTNSVKFTRGDRRPGATPHRTADAAVVTRLGEGVAESGQLTPQAIGRTVDAIADLVDDARREGPLEIVAVGTAGLRQALNRDVFVEAVLARCGVTVEIISGQEEARLAYLAAVSALPLTGHRLLVFDSGGGSSQFTFGNGSQIEEQFSLDVGAVRYTEQFGLADAVTRETVDAALAAMAGDLGALEGRPRPDMVIAIGGTSTNLAAVKHSLVRYDPDVVHGTVVDVVEVDRQIEAYRRRPAAERREIAGLQPARAEVILAGACIVRTILTLAAQDAVTVSDRGLRHGVAAERFGS
jgi:exopolyphosphatase/guanosine-5'-triphosphate,3'-diphosphate pyrophosphatase